MKNDIESANPTFNDWEIHPVSVADYLIKIAFVQTEASVFESRLISLEDKYQRGLVDAEEREHGMDWLSREIARRARILDASNLDVSYLLTDGSKV